MLRHELRHAADYSADRFLSLKHKVFSLTSGVLSGGLVLYASLNNPEGSDLEKISSGIVGGIISFGMGFVLAAKLFPPAHWGMENRLRRLLQEHSEYDQIFRLEPKVLEKYGEEP